MSDGFDLNLGCDNCCLCSSSANISATVLMIKDGREPRELSIPCLAHFEHSFNSSLVIDSIVIFVS